MLYIQGKQNKCNIIAPHVYYSHKHNIYSGYFPKFIVATSFRISSPVANLIDNTGQFMVAYKFSLKLFLPMSFRYAMKN